MTFVYFILLLSVIIVIHELGHLLTAKLFGVYCYEFSFGMGPKIISKKGKETTYSIRWIPIGGYVSMAGEQDGENANPEIEVPYERTINGIKPWKKIIIMLAGVTMNFILAWLLVAGILMHNGAYALAPKPVVDSIVENSPADKAGFEAGDVIKKVVFADGTVIKPKTFTDISIFTQTYDGEVTYTVERDGQTYDLTTQPEYNEELGRYLVGIGIPQGEIVEINPLNSFYYSGVYLLDTTRELYSSFARLLTGKGLDQLSGPVGIYQVTEQTASMGFMSFLSLIALLSLNVGIFNLLPLPVLDGGRALITIGEWIFHKPMNKKLETYIMAACWVVLIGLMVFATWQDILRLIK